jgi:nitrogen regulatory protein PII
MKFLISDLGRSSDYLMGRECNLLFYCVAIVPASDSLAKPIIDDILDVISTGSHYDGKTFVYHVAEGYDIGTKETSYCSLFYNRENNNKMLH